MKELSFEQIDRAEAQLGDGWSIDRVIAWMCRRLDPACSFDDDDGRGGWSLAKIVWREASDDEGGHRGGRYRPVLNVRHFNPCEYGAVSYGGDGMDFDIGASPVKNKAFSRLARATRELTKEDLRRYVAEEAACRTQRGAAAA